MNHRYNRVTKAGSPMHETPNDSAPRQRPGFPWEDPSRQEKPSIFMSPYTEDPYHPDPYGGRPR